MLEINTVPWLGSTQLQISVNGTSYPLVKPKPGSQQTLLLETAAADGKISLEFRLVGDVAEGSDVRKDLVFGLCSLGYAASTNLLSRLILFEEIVLSNHRIKRLKPTLT